ncbi:unnamed protein product [Spirodela intermedia]|uniref:Uncharacterized protein n=1 Tax=Spirodela intermedia TaxID=51605 RepID=A0A7I8KV50_SPIIN|nr:unnamed protein product [Spirodela intermedia]
MKGKDEGPAVGPPRLLAAVRCARAALLLSFLKSAPPRSVSVAAALEEQRRTRELGRAVEVADANLRAVQAGVVRRRQEFRLCLVVVVLQALLVLAIPIVYDWDTWRRAPIGAR